MEKEYTLFNLSFLIIVGLILIVLSALISFIITTRLVLPNDVTGRDGEVVDFTGITVPLGTFTTDLRDSTRRIARVEIVVEVESRKAIEQIEERSVQLNDRIITILRSKTAEELKGKEGRIRLGEEIKNGLEEFLTFKIVNVYFLEFIVQ